MNKSCKTNLHAVHYKEWNCIFQSLNFTNGKRLLRYRTGMIKLCCNFNIILFHSCCLNERMWDKDDQQDEKHRTLIWLYTALTSIKLDWMEQSLQTINQWSRRCLVRALLRDQLRAFGKENCSKPFLMLESRFWLIAHARKFILINCSCARIHWFNQYAVSGCQLISFICITSLLTSTLFKLAKFSRQKT